MATSIQLIKETGATFTPLKLANFISDKILSYFISDNQRIKVLDPACGEGMLLNSISKKLIDKNTDFELIGFDSNAEFLGKASSHLNYLHPKYKISLTEGDFLKQVDPKENQGNLFDSLSDKSQFINGSIDLIIANPPYVRTQILGTEYAQMIAKKFGLKGRVDLYYPFLIGMTYALKKNGLIGVITSNRYLSTKSGISVRKFIKDNFDILEVIDLGDTKLFDAAVLPAILIGRKKSNSANDNSKFTKIYEELNDSNNSLVSLNNFYDILYHKKDGVFKADSKKYKKTSGRIKFLKTKDHSWALLSNSEDKWINKINESALNVVGDLFKVRVGIKTTADKVFIKQNWEDEIDTPEQSLLKKMISQENIEPWKISNEKVLKVLYPHFSIDGKKKTIDLDEFPKAKKYLLSHKDRLSSRKYLIEAGRQWFEIWVPQNPSFWELPKLVFPDISSYPRFYFDESKRIVNGNCYWMVAKSSNEIDQLLLIQGVANSSLMTKYHDLMFNNKLYSGRRRYFAQYVEKYPLPDIMSPSSQKIISIVKNLNSQNILDKEKLIQELEITVAEAFNVDPIPLFR